MTLLINAREFLKRLGSWDKKCLHAVNKAYPCELWRIPMIICAIWGKIQLDLSTTATLGNTRVIVIECFHSRGQHLCKFIETKESVCIRKEFNSHRTGLGHQHGRRFIVLGHQYGRRDVMWKHSILLEICSQQRALLLTTSRSHDI